MDESNPWLPLHVQFLSYIHMHHDNEGYRNAPTLVSNELTAIARLLTNSRILVLQLRHL